MIQFGVGCFNFGLRYKDTLSTTAEAYCNSVERALYQLPHISRESVDIDHSEDPTGEITIEGPPPSLGEGKGGFPLPTHFSLRFDLVLPLRVQRELVAHLDIDPHLPEAISVTILEQFEGPVTFVHFNSEDPDADPSFAVVVVREYLKREFASESSPIYFEWLGPSPFHVDLSLQRYVGAVTATTPPVSKSGFVTYVTPQIGYDRIDCRYLSGRYGDDDEAYQSLIQELGRELSVYYAIVACDAKELDAWPEIDNDFKTIRQLSSAKGFWADLRGFFKCQALLRSLFVSLTNFQLLRTDNTASIKRAFKTTFEIGVSTHLRRFVEEEMTDRNDYPTAEVLALIEFLERRYMKTWEVTILALASLVGALLGVLIAPR